MAPHEGTEEPGEAQCMRAFLRIRPYFSLFTDHFNKDVFRWFCELGDQLVTRLGAFFLRVGW